MCAFSNEKWTVLYTLFSSENCPPKWNSLRRQLQRRLQKSPVSHLKYNEVSLEIVNGVHDISFSLGDRSLTSSSTITGCSFSKNFHINFFFFHFGFHFAPSLTTSGSHILQKRIGTFMCFHLVDFYFYFRSLVSLAVLGLHPLSFCQMHIERHRFIFVERFQHVYCI